MILLILSLEISEESEFILVLPGLLLLGPGVRGWGQGTSPSYVMLSILKSCADYE